MFTQQAGRITSITKGTRNTKNYRQGNLQPFTPLLVNWRGNGALPSLTGVEPAGPAHRLTGKLCYCGLYLNELILRLTVSQDPHPILFAHYTQALATLEKTDVSNQHIEPILRIFECQLLQQLGLGLTLTQDIHGQPIDPQGYYMYHIPQGPEPCLMNDASLQGSTLLALAAEQGLRLEQHREARQLLRQVIHYHLGGRPLKSRDFFVSRASTTNPLKH
jgi:DNA repair protein RecO (recombination protein O)